MKSGLTFFIAFRYFFAKKSQRVINIISMISVLGVVIGTAALIIVLSVFNGFQDLILRLYNSFDSDLKISLNEGKSFNAKDIDLSKLRAAGGVAYLSEIVEESALAKLGDKQYIVTLKGVGDDYQKMTGIDTMIDQGVFKLMNGDTDFAVVGNAIAYNLGLSVSNIFAQIELYGARRDASSLDPQGAFNRRFISPSGIFAVQQEFDTKYIIVPLRFAQEIFDYENLLTGIEIGVKAGADANDVKKELSVLLGSKYKIENRFEQHQLIYKIMRSEKWAVFLILMFILIIAIFNVISSLTMLVIEKKKDIAIMRSMGAEVSLMRRIFLTEGMLITLTGIFIGLILGLIICLLQQQFGLIQLSGSGSFVIDAYPVKLSPKDFIYVFLTVSFIGLLAAWYPSRRLIKSGINLKMISGED